MALDWTMRAKRLRPAAHPEYTRSHHWGNSQTAMPHHLLRRDLTWGHFTPAKIWGRPRVPVRLLGAFALVLVWGLFGAAAAWAQSVAVALELVLAADGSGSIDYEELKLQRDGYAKAITSRRVIEAIQFGPRGRIAVAYVEWGSPTSQHTIVDWTIIFDRESAERFAFGLRTRPRQATGYNSISNAIVYSADMIHGNDIDSIRKIIDVSADAGNFGGQPMAVVREAAVASGITINALSIARPGSTRPGGAGRGYATLEDYFANEVIGGPGAFVVVAGEDTSFADAVFRKLILEIAGDNGGVIKKAGLPDSRQR